METLYAADTRPHVLVVDDEVIIREEIVEFLAAQGFEAASVSNGAAALQTLDADPLVTVMLSDIRMPEMDGLTLAAAAIAKRGEQHALEVVMLTGHATVSDAAASARLRAIDFLLKPLSFVNLKASLTRAHQSAVARRTKWQQNQALETMYGDTVRQVGDLQVLVGQLQSRMSKPADAHRAEDGGRNAFMAVVNHELRTPLVPIIGLAELIEDSPDAIDPLELKSLARAIRMGGERLERALSRITALADLVAGRVVVQTAPCRPDRIVQIAERTIADRLQERQQTLTTTTGFVPALLTDSGKVTQVLDEVLDNASRFSPPSSELRLSVTNENDGVVFRVTDAGPGMTDAEIEVAGRDFQQVDMSMTRRVEGLGIGLPIARRIAGLLGGTLSIDSTPGHGTAVSLFLPASSVLARTE